MHPAAPARHLVPVVLDGLRPEPLGKVADLVGEHRTPVSRVLQVRALGTAALIRAPGPDAARAVLSPDRYAGIEVHSWQFGGRPS